VKAVKGVRFSYKPTPQTLELLSTFRALVNDAIRISLDENVRGRLKLRDRTYKEFQKRYGVTSRFPYSVAEVAWSIVKKHKRWHRRPYASRLILKMDEQTSRSTTPFSLYRSRRRNASFSLSSTASTSGLS